MQQIDELEKLWIKNILRMEVTEHEKIDYLISEGFDIDDIFDVAIEEQ